MKSNIFIIILLITSLLAKNKSKITGTVNLNLSQLKGNNNLKSVYLFFENKISDLKNYYIINGNYYYVKNSNRILTNQRFLKLKYEYFLHKRIFFNSDNSWKRNNFKKLQLRSIYSLSIGINLTNKPQNFFVDLSIGLSYIVNDYQFDNDDNQFEAVKFATKLKYNFPSSKIILFYKGDFLSSIFQNKKIKLNHFIFNSKMGVKFPFYKKIIASFNFNIDWDKKSIRDNASIDIKYFITLGYSW